MNKERHINKYQSYDLLPCPLCKDDAEFVPMSHTIENFVNKPTIRCIKCGCELTGDSTLALIHRWNNREHLISIIDGDILLSQADIICHQVNCQRAMNSGLAKQIRETYPEVYTLYKNTQPKLGTNLYVYTNSETIICNMYAQDKYGYDGKQYTDTEALKQCLSFLKEYAVQNRLSVAIPYKIGCCRGGADWDNVVYPMICDIFADYGALTKIWRLDKE